MSFIDLFIERTPDAETPATAKSSKPTVAPIVPRLGEEPIQTSYAPSQSITSEDMSKFNDHFDELFTKANLPGPDYFEFSKMCQAMSSLPDDSKFSTAFIGLQVQGLTKQKLIESANHYIAIIDESTKDFNNTIDSKILIEASKKRQLAEERKKGLVEKMNLISQLQAELSKDNAEIELLTNEANEQEQKASEKTTLYKAAGDAKKTTITSDILKITSIIK